MKKIITTLFLITLLLFLTGCDKPNLDSFAKCVSESGMTIYGTYWCPHCQNVKKSFGSSIEYINNIECDENGPNGQPEKCIEAGIEGYPSFVFGDGMKIAGEMTLQNIADKTGCELPKGIE